MFDWQATQTQPCLFSTLSKGESHFRSLVCIMRNSKYASTSIMCTLRNSKCAFRIKIQNTHFAVVWKQSMLVPHHLNPLSWENISGIAIGNYKQKKKKKPSPGFLGKSYPTMTPKCPLSWENGNMHAAPLMHPSGGGGGNATLWTWWTIVPKISQAGMYGECISIYITLTTFNEFKQGTIHRVKTKEYIQYRS